MDGSSAQRTGAGIAAGTICGALFLGGAWVLIEDATAGRWFGALVVAVAMVFFAVGAVGGLLGPERLPDRSIAELAGWPAVERALERPLREWFSGRAGR